MKKEQIDEEFRDLRRRGKMEISDNILLFFHSKLEEAYEKGKEEAYELIGQQYEVSKRLEDKIHNQTLKEVEKKIREISSIHEDNFICQTDAEPIIGSEAIAIGECVSVILQTIKEMKK